MTFALSTSILSGCVKTDSQDTPEQVIATENPQKKYNDATVSVMQKMSSDKDRFENCSNKKLRKKYEKLSEKAGKLTIKFQTEQLSEAEIQEGMEQMQKYEEQYEKLLEKLNKLEETD